MRLSTMALHVIGFVLAALAFTAMASAENGIAGYWKEPGGSIIRIQPCGPDMCATIITISPQAPARTDANNPDRGLRNRSLCGMQIGTGFHLARPDEAGGGHLYDPKSGKTYQGSMRSEGDSLFLRGYIGLRLFGRTEVWQRTFSVPICTLKNNH